MMLINLLWTGGLDSTFRLVELAQQEIAIQPYYIVDAGRKSYIYEKKAMENILQLLRKKSLTKAEIRDVVFVQDKSIGENKEITMAWRNLHNFNKLGSQYDILSRFAFQNNLKLEVGLENSDRSKATVVLKKFGSLILKSYISESNPNISSWNTRYEINRDKALPDVINIFQNLRFPSHLFNIEKVEEAELLKKWGCEDILKATWFCHNPIFGYPCGNCNPCKDAINEGMAWRVPLKGRILGSIRKPVMGVIGRATNLLHIK